MAERVLWANWGDKRNQFFKGLTHIALPSGTACFDITKLRYGDCLPNSILGILSSISDDPNPYRQRAIDRLKRAADEEQMEPRFKVISDRFKQLSRFYRILQALNQSIQTLPLNESAATQLEAFCQNLETSAMDYFIQVDKVSNDDFRHACERLIREANPILEKYPSLKYVLGHLSLAVLYLGAVGGLTVLLTSNVLGGSLLFNLMLATASVSMVYGIAMLFNKATTGNFMFFSKNKSVEQLNGLETVITAPLPH